MGIPLRSGRFFTAQDDEHSKFVIVIDEAFARKYFPQQNPLGKQVNFEDGEVGEIIGVVGHVNQWGLGAEDQFILQAQFYFPFMQFGDKSILREAHSVDVVIRAAGNPLAAFGAVRGAMSRMNSQQVVYGAQTMDQIVADSLAVRRFAMILLGVFAALALALSAVGIYGVISYLVGQRTHEIGIRIALGAQRKDVLLLVLGEGVKMALIGVAIGILAALGLTRLIAGLLYAVSPTDPATFAAVTITLLFVALLACYIPARRAMQVDPMVSLRYE